MDWEVIVFSFEIIRIDISGFLFSAHDPRLVIALWGECTQLGSGETTQGGIIPYVQLASPKIFPLIVSTTCLHVLLEKTGPIYYSSYICSVFTTSTLHVVCKSIQSMYLWLKRRLISR